MKVIIVGVDDSPTAYKAAESAREIALATQSRLHVVTAFDGIGVEVHRSGSDTWITSDAGRAEQTAKDVAARLATQGLAVTSSAVRGKPAEALINEAERNHADMIVVGNLRMRGLSRVLGSVANTVAHSAPCDVFIVKTDELKD
jgi:nucleotide-binding universal stress UspA family protein